MEPQGVGVLHCLYVLVDALIDDPEISVKAKNGEWFFHSGMPKLQGANSARIT